MLLFSEVLMTSTSINSGYQNVTSLPLCGRLDTENGQRSKPRMARAQTPGSMSVRGPFPQSTRLLRSDRQTSAVAYESPAFGHVRAWLFICRSTTSPRGSSYRVVPLSRPSFTNMLTGRKSVPQSYGAQYQNIVTIFKPVADQ